jgi:hypothetical protein
MSLRVDRRIVHGLVSLLSMLFIYFGIGGLASGIEHTLHQFGIYWKYILAISSGFGVQTFLYTHIKSFNISCKGHLAVSGSFSTGSMVACCLHHVTDLLPIVGGAAGFLLLAYYIEPLLLVGVLSSWTGVVFMISTIQKNMLYGENEILKVIFGTLNFERMRYAALALSTLILVYFLVTYSPF